MALELVPWTEEPTGPQIRYMTRVSRPDGTSRDGFVWPRKGYVECHKWEAWMRWDSPMARALSFDGGLYGFIDGKGDYFLGLSMYGQDSLVQLCVVDEAISVRWIGEDIVPRCWVKYSGTLDEVCEALEREGTPYALDVRSNLIEGWQAGSVRAPNLLDQLSEAARAFRKALA